MFNTNIVNNFGTSITALPSNTTIENGNSWTAPWTGSQNLLVLISGFGTCVIQDIGSTHIPGDDPGVTWGVLVVYQGIAIVGRYEGGGHLQIVVNNFGQISLSGMSLREVDLPALIIP